MAGLDRAVLAALRGIDSPTIANAIEAFAVRDRTEGFVSHRIRCLFPEMGVLAYPEFTGSPVEANGHSELEPEPALVGGVAPGDDKLSQR